jgi:hypothetical protein
MPYIAYALKPGFHWNPLKKLPRNGPCICQSGKKYKKCCLPLAKEVVDAGEFMYLSNKVKEMLRIK